MKGSALQGANHRAACYCKETGLPGIDAAGGQIRCNLTSRREKRRALCISRKSQVVFRSLASSALPGSPRLNSNCPLSLLVKHLWAFGRKDLNELLGVRNVAAPVACLTLKGVRQHEREYMTIKHERRTMNTDTIEDNILRILIIVTPIIYLALWLAKA